MLLIVLRIAKDWTKKESRKVSGVLSGLWTLIGLVSKGEALSLVGLVVLCLVASYFSQIYDNQISALAVFSVAILIWKGRQWLRWPLLVFSGYLVLSAFWHFGTDDGLSAKIQAVTAAVTGRHTLFVILLGIVSIVINPSLSLIAPFFLVSASLMTLVLGYPILKNPSTNAAMIVMFLPFCRRWWMWLLTLWIVASQQGATAWLMLSVIFFVTIIKYSTRTVFSISLLGSLGLASYIWFARPSFFIFYDRWDEYKLAARFWWENINPWIGAGLGSFQVLGPAMQKWDSRPITEVWMSLHSDVLQLIFELGVIGTCFAAILLGDCILRSEYSTRLSLLAACLFGLFYFPMQIPLVAFFLIIIVVKSQIRL